jgi:predicted AAA+ superfamily ATPase
MNLDKARHLENILRENDNNGIAIAITGSWGVGKTFFWKKFLEKNARSEQERNFCLIRLNVNSLICLTKICLYFVVWDREFG